MTDTTKYVEQALRELDLVKSEDSLMGWNDVWCGSTEYLFVLSPAQVRQIEDAFHEKLRQFMPAGLAG